MSTNCIWSYTWNVSRIRVFFQTIEGWPCSFDPSGKMKFNLSLGEPYIYFGHMKQPIKVWYTIGACIYLISKISQQMPSQLDLFSQLGADWSSLLTSSLTFPPHTLRLFSDLSTLLSIIGQMHSLSDHPSQSK